MTAADDIDPDRFRYEDATDCPDFQRRCRDTDHRIRNDMQALLLAAEDMFTAWAEDGLLDRNILRHRWNSEDLRWEDRRVIAAPADAVAWHLSVLRDIINDARSLTAIEAEEVARGER